MSSGSTFFLVRKLIPLFAGTEIEFTTAWCHARFLTLEEARPSWKAVFSVGEVEDGPAEESERTDEPDDDHVPTGYVEVEFRGEARIDTHRSYDPLLLSRPSLIKVLSLLTFLTDHLYTTGSPDAGSSWYPPYEADLPPASQAVEPRFVVGGIDRSSELAAIIAASADGHGVHLLLFSLLDRWRKGRALLEMADAGTEEEATLCFFHILETTGHHFRREAEAEIQTRVRAFVTRTVDDILLPDVGAHSEISERLAKEFSKALSSLDYFGARAQIAFALGRLGLIDAKTRALLGRLVGVRNDIAHGQLGAAKALQTWPVRPFFLQTDPRDDDLLAPFVVLSARTIAALCKADTWSAEWEREKARLHPPDFNIKAFMHAGASPPPREFEAGVHNDVRPSSLVWLWLRKLKRKGVAVLEPCLGPYVCSVVVSDANADEVLLPALLLADSKDNEIRNAAREAVRAVWVTDALAGVQPSDVWKYVSQFDVEPPWLTSWARKDHPPAPDEILHEPGVRSSGRAPSGAFGGGGAL